MWKIIFLLIPLVFSCSFQPSSVSSPVNPKPVLLTNDTDTDTDTNNTIPANIFYGQIQITNYTGKYNYDNMFIVYMYADNNLGNDNTFSDYADKSDLVEMIKGVYKSRNPYTGEEGYYDTNTIVFVIIEKDSYPYIGTTNFFNFTPVFFEPFISANRPYYGYIVPEGVYFLKVSNAPFFITTNRDNEDWKVYAYFERIHIETNYSYSSVEKAINNLNAVLKLGVQAKTTNLIVWDHGNAVFPMGDNDTINIKTNYASKYIGYSETTDKSLSEEELVYVIKSVFGNKKPTTLMFDACNMFLIEEMYYYKDLAEWFVGSAHFVPASGFNYQKLIFSFVSNNNIKSALYTFISNYNTEYGKQDYGYDLSGSISSTYDFYYISAVSSEGINKYLDYLEKFYDLLMSSSFQTRFFYSIAYPFSCLSDLFASSYSQPFIFKTVFWINSFYEKGYAFSSYFHNMAYSDYLFYYFDATDIRNALSNLIIILNTNSVYKPEIAPFITPDIPKFVNLLNQYQQNFLNNDNYIIFTHDFPTLMYMRRPYPYAYNIYYHSYPNTISALNKKIKQYDYFYYHNKLLKDKPKIKELLNGKAIDNGYLTKIYFSLKLSEINPVSFYSNIIYNLLTEKTNYQDLGIEDPDKRLVLDREKISRLSGITYLENAITPIYTFTNKNNLFDYYLVSNMNATYIRIAYIFCSEFLGFVSGLSDLEHRELLSYSDYYLYEYYKMQTNYAEFYFYNTNYSPHKLVGTLVIPAFFRKSSSFFDTYDTNFTSSEPFHYFKANIRGIYTIAF
ncbi:MAG: clostripain-related cysteine peptidase [Brevinematia bacterium]